MSDRRYNAMRQAVALALSGHFNNWWTVAARLRAKGVREADVDWSQGQRVWLDQLCNEARQLSQDTAPPYPSRPVLAVIDGRGRRGAAAEP
jgi:hypothetical protein